MNTLIAPAHIRPTKPLRANLVKTSPVHGTVTWVAIGIIGLAMVFASVYFIRSARSR